MPDYEYEIIRNRDGSVNCYRFASSREGIRYFVDNYGAPLAQVLAGSNIYLAVAIAQKTRESAYGTSNAARLYNNFGGIMNYGNTPYATGAHMTADGRPLAIFSSPADCFRSYLATLLSPNKKYISKGLLTAGTPQGQLKAIAMGGYCTSPAPDQYYKAVLPTLNLCLEMFNTGKIILS